MALGRDEVLRIAHLARLRLNDEETEMFAAQLSNIVELVNQLREVDTVDCEPMVHAIDRENVLREDSLNASLSRDDVLANAPSSNGECFLVPPVFE